MARDFQFGLALNFDKSYIDLKPCGISEVDDIVATYRKNMGRVASLVTTPAWLVHKAMTWGGMFFPACLNLYGNINMLLGMGSPPTTKMWEEINIEVKRLLKLQSVQELTNSEPDAHAQMQEGFQNFEILMKAPRLLDGGESFTNHGADAIFYSMLTQAYTAFETAAGDLWEAAVNQRPTILAKLKGAPTRIQKMCTDGGGTTQRREQEQTGKGIQLSINDIAELTSGTFNLNGAMGSILRNELNFIRLEGIRRAYSMAFNDHSDDIDKSLASHSLDALSSVRNLIVHRAGFADQEYADKSAKVADAPKLKLDEPLILDGKGVSGLISPVVVSTVGLLRGVIAWINRHQ